MPLVNSPGCSQQAVRVNSAFAHLDEDILREASTVVVEPPCNERGNDDGSEVRVAPRERWSWTNWSGPLIVSVLGVIAVGVIVSAITMVSREPLDTTGV